jgi:uncharacterized membrane protein YjgN (DUF898 family)
MGNMAVCRDESGGTQMTDNTLSTMELPPPERLSFSYVKRPGLLKLTVVNFLLGLVTLGFYRFWAKTNVRKHIWSSVHINGEPLEYTGTGVELFKGFLVVFFVLVLPYILAVAAANFVQGPGSTIAIVLQMVFFLAIYVLWGFAIYKARKFQLSRTNWRGIRGTLVGSAITYSLLYFGSQIAKSMSMGWATPVMNTVLAEQITNDMRFGDAAFKFKGRAGALYPTYAMCWLLSVAAIVLVIVLLVSSTSISSQFRTMFDPDSAPETIAEIAGYLALAGVALFFLFMLIIPMLWAIYTAKELRTFANYTRFDGVPFILNATTGSVIRLTIINLLLIVFTLGIAWPFVQQRTVKFAVDRLKLDGLVDVDRIRQSSARMDTRGEGLADAFDVGGL